MIRRHSVSVIDDLCDTKSVSNKWQMIKNLIESFLFFFCVLLHLFSWSQYECSDHAHQTVLIEMWKNWPIWILFDFYVYWSVYYLYLSWIKTMFWHYIIINVIVKSNISKQPQKMWYSNWGVYIVLCVLSNYWIQTKWFFRYYLSKCWPIQIMTCKFQRISLSSLYKI